MSVAVKTAPKFEMTITDNGIGFEKDNKARKSSLGLLNMENRAASINFTIAINSSPGNGTVISLTENENA